MDQLSRRFVNIIKSDPAVETAVIYTGGNGPRERRICQHYSETDEQRKLNPSQVIDRLRPKLVAVPGARAICRPCRT